MTRDELIKVFSVFNAYENAPFNQDEQDVEDKVLAHDQAQREEIARLREALLSLRNEVDGALGIAEPALRVALGNTNVNCIQRRLDEVDQALSKEATHDQ